jgi:hypothetical protein
LFSINYLHWGKPKHWDSSAPRDHDRVWRMASGIFGEDARLCPQFLRHKSHMLSPAAFKRFGIPVHKIVHYPGEMMLTFPKSFHFGFNVGWNCAESVNFATRDWIPLGRVAKKCRCSLSGDLIKLGPTFFSNAVPRWEHRNDPVWLAEQSRLEQQRLDAERVAAAQALLAKQEVDRERRRAQARERKQERKLLKDTAAAAAAAAAVAESAPLAAAAVSAPAPSVKKAAAAAAKPKQRQAKKAEEQKEETPEQELTPEEAARLKHEKFKARRRMQARERKIKKAEQAARVARGEPAILVPVLSPTEQAAYDKHERFKARRRMQARERKRRKAEAAAAAAARSSGTSVSSASVAASTTSSSASKKRKTPASSPQPLPQQSPAKHHKSAAAAAATD